MLKQGAERAAAIAEPLADPIPAEAVTQLNSISKILNIGWIAEGAATDATIICQRSSNCPRDKHCLGKAPPKLKPQIDRIREALVTP